VSQEGRGEDAPGEDGPGGGGSGDYGLWAGPVRVEAFAKLTLTLRVTGVRADGYHLLDAEMVTVDLADTLDFRPGDGLTVLGATGGPVPDGPDNLVRRALALLGRRAEVALRKRIPAGGGLGGGSADAAAVLRWAGSRDVALAARLGADVPFCLLGGRARVSGIGEGLEALPFAPVAGRAYTVLTPPFGVSTPEVYQAWDRLGGPTGTGTNDLEGPALTVEPRLAVWRDRLGDSTGATPMLAGSGATWFVAGAYPGDGRVVVRVARPPAPAVLDDDHPCGRDL
jgi:4-diphosphocytidyl-2-C-methyl-D-erythritol kinase